MTHTRRLDRAATTLGLASIASLVFIYEGFGDFRFMTVSGPAIAIAAILGVLAVAAGITGIRLLALVAGLGFAAAAVLQVVASAAGEDWLGANLSTMSFWLGLAVGLLVVGTAPHIAATATEGK